MVELALDPPGDGPVRPTIDRRRTQTPRKRWLSPGESSASSTITSNDQATATKTQKPRRKTSHFTTAR
jgi:hypothetical protein